MTANSNGPALNGKPDHGTATDSKETNGSSTNGSGATPIRQYDYSTPGSEGYNIPKFVYDVSQTLYQDVFSHSHAPRTLKPALSK